MHEIWTPRGACEGSSRQTQRLRNQVDMFAAHARMLKHAPSVDGLMLLGEANNLLKNLRTSRADFEELQALIGTLSRSLSSRPPATGGMAPAAQWGNELRAGSKQFAQSVINAESEIRGLYDSANEQLNRPTRTPKGVFRVVANKLRRVALTEVR